jgi:hypothetical protein
VSELKNKKLTENEKQWLKIEQEYEFLKNKSDGNDMIDMVHVIKFFKFIKDAWNTRPEGEFVRKSDVLELVKGVCNVLEFLKLDEKFSTKNLMEQFNTLETHSVPSEGFNVGDVFYYPYQGYVREGKITKCILGIMAIDDNSKIYHTKDEAEQALKESKE